METDRSRRILAALVREYIASGEPVASSLLAGAAGLGVSSATIRAILVRLEDEGFVQQPHTSAGRIPTDRGYRSYVDLLLEVRHSGRTAADRVEAQLRRQAEPIIDSLLSHASHVVSQASGHVGFALRPAHEVAVFDRIEFIPISTAHVLVVIVARGGHVIQKVVEAPESLDLVALRQAANYLNEEFSGFPIRKAREEVLERLREERALYDELMKQALTLASSTLSDLPEEDAIYIEGAASLLGGDETITRATLQTLLLLIEEKQRLVHLLSEYIDGPGLTVVIGAEHPDPDLRSFSVVASTYDDGSGVGTIGVLGPTRMRYSRAIAVVDGAAQAVSRVLRHPN
ncbi:MAG TPA: heat-inducible transcriptional repressor HrcA [Vicinamibacterales bacterium]|jgi:heat-inducible transcriptional repressor|nr:heat-inducible transcriptional repressor HrcA [Vicinamibacterales bacterium]